jgi:DNA ligase-1
MIRTRTHSFTLAPPVAWSIPAAPRPAIDARPPRVIPRHMDDLAQLVVDYTPRFFPAGGAIVERKHDGIRALWIKGQLLTRNGVPIWCSAHLWPQLAELERRLGGAFMIDGEYEEPGGFIGTLRRFNETRYENGPAKGWGKLYIWDAVPLDVWQGQAHGLPLIARKAALRAALAGAGDGLVYVGHRDAHCDGFAASLANEAFAAGHEGVVIKEPLSLHLCGRSRAWQRIKRKLTLDLRVIGYTEGKGDRAGTLANIIVDLEGRAVKVGIGFSERERAELFWFPERIAGRIAEISAMEVSEWGGLRQPSFIRWRDDKES